MIHISKRSPGKIVDYFIDDNWGLVFGIIFGFSIFTIIKVIKNSRKSETGKNSSENKTIKVPNPRGGDDSTALAKIYEKCFKKTIENDENALYLVEDTKVAAIVKKLIKSGASKSNESLVISVGYYLYALAKVHSQQVVIKTGNSEIIINLANKAVGKVAGGAVIGAILPLLTPPAMVGAAVLVGLALLTAREKDIDCSKFVRDVSHSSDEIHHVVFPEPKQDRVYITTKEKVEIYEDFDRELNSDPLVSETETGSETETCPSPLYERYFKRVSTETENKKKPLAERTKYLSDLPELDPVLDYEVENAMTKADKNNEQYKKEKDIRN